VWLHTLLAKGGDNAVGAVGLEIFQHARRETQRSAAFEAPPWQVEVERWPKNCCPRSPPCSR
jgi:hypothetical protein